MDVKAFQKVVTEFVLKWDKKRNVTSDEDMAFIHLVEEVGELAMQYTHKKQRPELFQEKEIADALSDILMQVFRLAHLHQLDMEDEVLKIIKEEEGMLKE